MKYRGRNKPYTAIGINRVPCARCGAPSMYQWQVCANKNRWRGVCLKCDISLNRVVLKFMRFKNEKELMALYKLNGTRK